MSIATAPGPKRLLAILPSLVLPPSILGAILTASKQYGIHNLPAWSIVLSCLLIHPVLLYVNCYIGRFIDQRAARKEGAILAPLVTDTGMTIISKLQKSFFKGYPGDVFQDYLEKYGQSVVGFNFFGNKVIYTTEPHHVKAILATQFESFDKGATLFSQFGSLLGVGIFNSDGDMWKFHRAMTRPFFTKERISDFEIYATMSDKALNLAQARLAEGYSFDFQDLVGRFTLDAATAFLCGRSVNSLSAGLPYPPHSTSKNTPLFYNHPSTSFLRAFNEGLNFTALRLGAGDDWPLYEFWKDEVAECRKEIDGFVEPLIKEALERREKKLRSGSSDKFGDGEENEERTLVEHLVNHTQDPKILVDELLNLLVAGRDTTMSLLSYSLYMLIEHPDIEDKLRKEILSKVGARAVPTYEALKEMRYTRAFLNGNPLNGRMNNKPVVLESPKGSNEPPLYVPTGTTMSYSVFHMHRRKDLWGPDALTFDPDRFLDSRLHTYLTPNPYIFCPFNAGPRICLGQQFAYHEATFFLVKLLQRFAHFRLDETKGVGVRPPETWKGVEGPQGTDRVMPHTTLTMSIKGGLWITMDELKVDDIEA
ncbi:hypothetical protein CVT24_002991 [Panaeolus cyanescens]|uniref:Cytochrome P450 n=1 Tax=Panaeolus cyanescens TaxID=181874 RepID=A0A409YXU8_9AGAR|nr:hypothetical protein CVT24_002991 [Panaeolus cyanescens]